MLWLLESHICIMVTMLPWARWQGDRLSAFVFSLPAALSKALVWCLLGYHGVVVRLCMGCLLGRCEECG